MVYINEWYSYDQDILVVSVEITVIKRIFYVYNDC